MKKNEVVVQKIPYDPTREDSLRFQRYVNDEMLGSGAKRFGALTQSHTWMEIVRAQEKYIGDHLGKLFKAKRGMK